MKKNITARIIKAKLYFKCSYCESPQEYPVVFFEDFKLYGYDCPKCYAKFNVIFVRDNVIVN